jgi:zinc protease
MTHPLGNVSSVETLSPLLSSDDIVYPVQEDKMIKGLTLSAVLVLAVCWAAPAVPAADLTNIHVLDNGLEVRLFPDAATPLVATLVLVRAGHAVDGQERLGFSHLLEHLVFAGTEEMDKDMLFDEVRAFGGYLNGFTRDDYMGYLMVGHRDHFRRQMELLSAILFRAALTEDAVASARQVVIEEIRRRESRPDTPVEEAFQRLLYEGSSYSGTGIGNEKTVGEATTDEIRSHYEQYYRPGNMVLLTAGGVDRGDLSVIDETFGAVSAGKVFRPKVENPPPLRGRRVYRFASDLPGVHIRIGYNGPDPRSGDAEALELLAAVLGGPGGALQKDLQSRGFSPRRVSAGLSLHTGFSRFVVSASFPEEESEGALEALLAAVGSLTGKGMISSDINRARNSLVAEEIMSREKLHYYLMGKASWVIAGGPGQGFSERRWDALGPGAVGRTAATYLDEAPYAALVATPHAKEDLEAAGDDSRLAREKLENGTLVIVEERPHSKVFAINILTRQRSALEPSGKAGIAGILHRLLPRGTEGMTRAQIEDELREIGAELSVAGDPTVPFGSFYTSRSYSFLRLQSPVASAARAVELIAGMIRHPSLEPEDVEDVVETVRDYISYRDAKPDTLASRLLAEALYGAEGFGADVLGSLETVSSISPAEIADFRRNYFSGRNLVVSVVGGLETKKAVELVSRHLGDLPPGETPLPPPAAVTSGPALVQAELGRSQSAIAAGAVGEEVEAGLKDALAVAAAVLNRRLYRQLREKEGLTYSVGAGLSFVGSRPVWMFSLGTSPEKIDQARSGIAREIALLRERGTSEEEISRVVNEKTGRLQMRMLSSLNRGFYLALAERFGFDHGYGEDYRTRLLAVTPAEVMQAGRDHLPAELVEVVVR